MFNCAQHMPQDYGLGLHLKPKHPNDALYTVEGFPPKIYNSLQCVLSNTLWVDIVEQTKYVKETKKPSQKIHHNNYAFLKFW